MELKYIIILAVVFLLLILIGLAIVNFSSEDMVDKYKKLSLHMCGKTPVELVNLLNVTEFAGKIRIKLKDTYFCDSISSSGLLTLSSKYANDFNIAGLAICAHELGHAFQYRDKIDKMYKHARLNKIAKISVLTYPLIITGIVSLAFGQNLIGYILFGFSFLTLVVAVISKLATIGIEKEASNNGMELLKVYANLTDEELVMAKKFLKSAKMTYVADLLKIMLKWTMLVRRR